MSLKWYGDKVRKRVEKAARLGVNRTMTECVVVAKHSHPFRNRTGTAERSIRIALPAQTGPDGATVGFWGSLAVAYFPFLEFGTRRARAFPTLAPAARRVYPRLAANIRAAWEGLG